MVGFAFCGSFCTHKKSLDVLASIVESGRDVQAIMSEAVWGTDTRFGTAADLRGKVEAITSREIVHTVAGAEPFGPSVPLDALIICPCTGNTLAKLAHGITDSAVTMAAKAHLRCDRPLLIALATNDAMSANLGNIGTMLSRKNVFFVPMRQDSPRDKPHSLVADFSLVVPSMRAMNEGRQLRPLFL